MKKIYLLLFVIAVSLSCFGQISQGGTPISWNHTSLSKNIPTVTVPSIDLAPIHAEDAITDQQKDIPWRFGIEIPLNISLSNSGLWETLANGNRIWRITIEVPGALTTNINYKKFYLPQGANLFLYNEKQVLGAFTALNNKENMEFATTLLPGDKVTLEYMEPANVSGQGMIELASVVHGYRDLFAKMKVFGSSGACNVNAVCDTAIWGDEIRSVVMLLTSGNSRFCSGALVNNTANDGTPYVLTARHCSPSTNNIFMFNYQSAQCSPSIDGPTTQTVSGCTLISNNSPSDFHLVKLSATPPASYKVFYAGWNADNIAANSSVGIHHPAGDVKKISHDYEPVVSSGYYTSGNDHWQVLDWNTGTTEGGSSGSPLFDQNHRIVGQLHGGNAACGNDEFDYYGKFSVSWNANSDTLKQLQYWLDPINSGATAINGYDPNGSSYNLDVAALSLTGIEKFICGDTASPKITFINKGNTALTSLTINYQLDGNTPSTLPWTGNLAAYQSTTVSLPILSGLTDGMHTYKVYTSSPNGSSDQNHVNDTVIYSFRATPQPMFASMTLTTDNFGSETSWAVKDTFGNVVLTGGGYSDVSGGATYNQDLCLSEKCFDFVLYDGFGDGFCCGFGSGSILLTETSSGDTLFYNNSFNGDSLVFPFCLGNASSISELTFDNVTVYPNPADEQLTIDFGNDNYHHTIIQILDITGRVVGEYKAIRPITTIRIDELKKGIYVVLLKNNQTVKSLKVVKQ
ncbi:MAG TPA: T9SS type A sorting domain-containing protein [Vicingaceae bacterium]|nr:T9SS type A sorting domain-containing protein [Vicingaceae bacterium]